MTHAVVGLLDEDTERRVRELRRGIEELVGATGLDALPLPHLTFVVSDDVDIGAAADAMQAAAGALERATFLAEPWTVFTGPPPDGPCAVVRSVTRTPELDAAREAIAGAVGACMRGISRYTTTGTWNPHITLASQGVPRSQLGAVVDLLVEREEPPWQGRIERLALVVEQGHRHRLAASVELLAA